MSFCQHSGQSDLKNYARVGDLFWGVSLGRGPEGEGTQLLLGDSFLMSVDIHSFSSGKAYQGNS